MNASDLRSKVCDFLAAREEKLKKREIHAVLDALTEIVSDELAAGDTSVALLGIGTLKSETIPARNYFDPRLQQYGVSTPRRKVRFAASSEMKRRLGATLPNAA